MDALTREVDVAPPQRKEFALAQAGHRCGEVERAVLLASRMTHERCELIRIEGDELARVPDRRAIHELGARRIARQTMLAHRVLENAVRDGHVAYDSSRSKPSREELVAHLGDIPGEDGCDRPVAPPGIELSPYRIAIVAKGRELTALNVLDVTEEAGGCLGKRRAIRPRLVRAGAYGLAFSRQQVRERILGLTASEVPGARATGADVS